MDAMYAEVVEPPQVIAQQQRDSERVRHLEAQVKELKVKLAEEKLNNTTAQEELRHLRQRMQGSEEAFIMFAERAREDREEASRKRVRAVGQQE